jgi:uncharacterized protein YndB with AHSA1/START domain
MTKTTTGGANRPISRIIRAPRNKVYQAFVDPEAMATWFAPDTMRAQVHTFDPREGSPRPPRSVRRYTI